MSRNKFLRTCIYCRTAKTKKELFRFTIINGDVVLDYFQKLEGRGFYLCKNKECIENITVKRIKNSLKKHDIDITYNKEEVLKILNNNLLKDIMSLLKLANKAGGLTANINRVVDAIESKVRFKLFIVAEDISKNSFNKIKKFLKNNEFIQFFSKKELGEVFGKNEVGIIGVKDLDFAEKIKSRIFTFENIFRGAYSNG